VIEAREKLDEKVDMQARMDALQSENAQLRERIEWFKRQLFGPKSEKRLEEVSADQLTLFEALQASADSAEPRISVPSHERRKYRSGEEVNDNGAALWQRGSHAHDSAVVPAAAGAASRSV